MAAERQVGISIASSNENDIDTVVVEPENSAYRGILSELLDLRFKGIQIFDSVTFYEKITGKVALNHIDDEQLLFANQEKRFQLYSFSNLKRFTDVCLSLLGLIVLSPAMLIVAIVLKTASRGSVLIKQERVGLRKKNSYFINSERWLLTPRPSRARFGLRKMTLE